MIMFPGVAYFGKTFGINTNFSQCGGIDLEMLMIISALWTSVICIQLLLIASRIQKSTVFFMLYLVTAASYFGFWFLSFAYTVLVCNQLPGYGFILTYIPVAYIVSSILLFFMFLKPKAKLILKLNTHVWDFEKMQYSANALVLRPDGKDVSNVTPIAIVSSLVGVFLGRILSDIHTLGIVELKAYSLVMALFFVGAFFVSFLSVGELYLAFLVWKKSRQKGKVMFVRELVDGNK